MASTQPGTDLLEEFKARIGTHNVITSPDLMRSYCTDWRGIYHGHTLCVLRPQNTQECADLVRRCAQANIVIIPQGGNTGLVGGATPQEEPRNVIISTTRMDKITSYDEDHLSMEVQAGVTLQEAQEGARLHHMLLPLSISSEGTANIGGVMATNAGGNNTLRYGNARERMIGLEIVLANGEVLNLLSDLRKDNTGYALRQLFIGSEGTLGIITKVRLRLQPSIKQRQTALCAIGSVQDGLKILALFKHKNPLLVHACEYMSAQSMALVDKYIENAHLPLPQQKDRDWLLIELASSDTHTPLEEIMSQTLESAMEEGLLQDAVLAESEQQRQALWGLREEHSQAQKIAGASVKNDISIPLNKIPHFVDEGRKRIYQLDPNIIVAPFGHIGDGNIHFNLIQAPGSDAKEFQAKGPKLEEAMGALAVEMGGSFSAEHGIGQRKVSMMKAWKNTTEMRTMHAIKNALDPHNLMNPGKLIPS